MGETKSVLSLEELSHYPNYIFQPNNCPHSIFPISSGTYSIFNECRLGAWPCTRRMIDESEVNQALSWFGLEEAVIGQAGS